MPEPTGGEHFGTDPSNTPENSAEPAAPDHFIDADTAESLGQEQRNTEFKLNYVSETKEALEGEIESRYHINKEDKSALGMLRNFIGKTKATFAGEYIDLNKAVRTAERESRPADKEYNEVKEKWRGTISELGVKVGKIFGKTAYTGAVGGLMTVGLFGGSLMAPAFLGALGGSAIGRIGVEVWRNLNPKEREARMKVMSTQQKILAEAIRMQQEAQPWLEEYEIASDERKAELKEYFARQREYFVNLTQLKSYEDLTTQEELDNGVEKPETTIADLSAVAEEKSSLLKKNEKRADFGAAAGGFVGGAGTNIIHNLLTPEPTQHFVSHSAHVKEYVANFDKDKISHIITKISPEDLKSFDPGFARQLAESGGYVFKYNPIGSAGNAVEALRFAADHGYNLTTALLKDGSTVHVLKGMSDAAFKAGLPQVTEIVKGAAVAAHNVYAEVVPIVAANVFQWLSSWKNESGKSLKDVIRVPVLYKGKNRQEREKVVGDVSEMTDGEVMANLMMYGDVDKDEVGEEKYQQIQESVEEAKNGNINERDRRYVEAFRDLCTRFGQQAIAKATRDIKEEAIFTLVKLRQPISPFTRLDAWVNRDLAKQQSFVLHPETQTDPEHYPVAEPLWDWDEAQKIADRMVGWQLYGNGSGVSRLMKPDKSAYEGHAEEYSRDLQIYNESAFLREVIEKSSYKDEIRELLYEPGRENGSANDLPSWKLAKLGRLVRLALYDAGF